ncbi:hypothetical protein T492DRAFT_434759 [Pavlovales sp. CCMP2436]|nr:hypothetical protein T492DRAFT_434759 [Pavlovales sp. CCMP2436]
MDGDRAPRGRDDDRERDGGGVQRAPRERSTRNDLPRGDREDGRVSSDTLTLSDQDVAYLVGRGGQTRVRLEAYSGAQLELNHGAAEVSGSKEARGRAKLAIQITLQQRNGGKLDIDYSVLEQREDLDIIDVPMDSVGFVLGAKGQAVCKAR